MTLCTRRNFLKTLGGMGLALSAGSSGLASHLESTTAAIKAGAVCNPTHFNYSLVHMYVGPRWGDGNGNMDVFISTGKQGNQLALTMITDWWMPRKKWKNELSAKGYRQLINEMILYPTVGPGDLELLLSKIGNIEKIIIYGRLNEPAFIPMRQMALSQCPAILWTIVEVHDVMEYKSVGFQPAACEIVTIMDINNSHNDHLSLLRFLYNMSNENSLICMDFGDIMNLFAGRFTKIVSDTIPYSDYRNGFNSFLKRHKAALRKTDGVFLDIFADDSISLYDINEMTSMIQDQANKEANIIFDTFIDHDCGDRPSGFASGFVNTTLILPA